MIWGDKEFEEADRLAKQGYSAAKIGVLMGDPGRPLSRNAVIGRMARRKGIRSKPGQPVLDNAEAKSIVTAIKKAAAIAAAPPPRPPVIFKGSPNKAISDRWDQQRAAAAWTPPTAPVALVDLSHRQCRWPIEVDGVTHFCGAPKIPETTLRPNPPYCEVHTRGSLHVNQPVAKPRKS